MGPRSPVLYDRRGCLNYLPKMQYKAMKIKVFFVLFVRIELGPAAG